MSRTALSSHHSRLTVFAESLAFDDDDYELTSHSHAHREHTRELPSFTHSACSRSAVRERVLAPASPSSAESFHDSTSHTCSLGASAAAPRHLALFAFFLSRRPRDKCLFTFLLLLLLQNYDPSSLSGRSLSVCRWAEAEGHVRLPSALNGNAK